MFSSKSIIFSVVLFFVSVFIVTAQTTILTAADFFQSVSQNYGTINEYEANINIVAGNTSMDGRVSYKRPNLLRIDFSSPTDQVIVFNGDLLTIYLPGPKAVLNQTVQGSEGNSSTGANLATPQGLQLMSRYYNIAYLSGQDPVPLDESNPDSEQVVKLLLTRRTTSEGFTTITLSINPNSKLIRRVEADSISGVRFVFTFTDYALNTGIPDTRFIYDAPSSANNYNNFLYSE